MSHCLAQRKYRKTEKGKKNHCWAENRRRQRLSKAEGKNMDDASSTGLPRWYKKWINGIKNHRIHMQTVHRCHFCGSYGLVVDKFPRRGYG